MPKLDHIDSVLVIGSGPIVIGQAAEFDYSGTQACLALKEENCRVILVNNNPATIMTDPTYAEAIYFEPLTPQSLQKIIEKEKPDALLATVGGQTGLNLAVELEKLGILRQNNVQLIGTSIESIMKAEDREAFRSLMHELNEPVPESEIVDNVTKAVQFSTSIGFPVIVRPAYTLGGYGGGTAHTLEQLIDLVEAGLSASPINQCLIEQSIGGLQEIEYEVMRDSNDTCITVCNMENVDPVGVHTGDSIVVAPSQTLTDTEYQMLRSVSIKIIRALGIVGGCNIQFAFHPETRQYYLIEVNPRVSRSSALASKATGYPIARMAAKISLGYLLHELINPVTGYTYASFEPALDYVVVKFPRWPFDKFSDADRKLGTQMKATGEVMALERNLEAAIQKAVRSLELKTNGLEMPELKSWSTDSLLSECGEPDDRRFLIILELLRRGVTVNSLHEMTKIHPFYLECFQRLINFEKQAQHCSLDNVTKEHLLELKRRGFSDQWLADTWHCSVHKIQSKRKHWQIEPHYKMVDTCAAEFTATTSYYYSSWIGSDDVDRSSSKKKIAIIGSGPIRIGQGIEFDYCSVHSVLSLQNEGYETILINNNPETVSTDYEIADRLYFEPLTVEDVLNVLTFEQAEAAIIQFGGQTAISLAQGLEEAGINILGSDQATIDRLEDRDLFYQFLQRLNIPHIPGETAHDYNDLIAKVEQIGFPVLLRPSYVIGGAGMIIVHSHQELIEILKRKKASLEYPILADSYMNGKEAEVDVLTDGEDILIPGIFEHVEQAGVHSGDSMAVTPSYSLSKNEKEQIVSHTEKIAAAMEFKGLFNIQFVVKGGKVYVLEVNPRASRTVPILSKVTGVNLVQLATSVLIGKSIKGLVGQTGLLPETNYYTVKAPIFSTRKIPGLDPKVGPEMKSTGEIIAIAASIEEGFHKVFTWDDNHFKKFLQKGEIHCEIDEEHIQEFLFTQKMLEQQGFSIVKKSYSEDEKRENSFDDWVKTDKASAVVTITKDTDSVSNKKRQLAIKHGLPVFTELATLHAAVQSLQQEYDHVMPINEWLNNNLKKEVSYP
jgi:carbamoyl-phosphate synthase large subunit